jgi:cephalosporin hydroxylase
LLLLAEMVRRLAFLNSTMITIIDEESGEVIVRDGGAETRFPLESADAFAAASRAWLRAGWDTKYVYSFTWLGRPVIQLPDDLLRIQEVIYKVRPDVLIETGIAHGGSLIFYASLFKAMGSGRAIGIDIDIRAHNRAAIERHELFPLITLIEGSSIAPETVARAREFIRPGERVMVVLDSHHLRDHVLAELRFYAPLVSVGSYVVVADGIMEDLVGAPRSRPDWKWNNPRRATLDFLAESKDFAQEEPDFPFNEGAVKTRVTYWPNAFLRRLK